MFRQEVLNRLNTEAIKKFIMAYFNKIYEALKKIPWSEVKKTTSQLSFFNQQSIKTCFPHSFCQKKLLLCYLNYKPTTNPNRSIVNNKKLM